jgi:four helix bundle protein
MTQTVRGMCVSQSELAPISSGMRVYFPDIDGDDMEKTRQYDLEDRLVKFATRIIGFAAALPKSRAVSHLAHQLIRSGTSPALNYAEAQGAESKRDFTHKLRIVLKELRESSVTLKIISHSHILDDDALLQVLLKECEELIAVFAKCVQTSEARRSIHG